MMWKNLLGILIGLNSLPPALAATTNGTVAPISCACTGTVTVTRFVSSTVRGNIIATPSANIPPSFVTESHVATLGPPGAGTAPSCGCTATVTITRLIGSSSMPASSSVSAITETRAKNSTATAATQPQTALNPTSTGSQRATNGTASTISQPKVQSTVTASTGLQTASQSTSTGSPRNVTGTSTTISKPGPQSSTTLGTNLTNPEVVSKTLSSATVSLKTTVKISPKIPTTSSNGFQKTTATATETTKFVGPLPTTITPTTTAAAVLWAEVTPPTVTTTVSGTPVAAGIYIDRRLEEPIIGFLGVVVAQKRKKPFVVDDTILIPEDFTSYGEDLVTRIKGIHIDPPNVSGLLNLFGKFCKLKKFTLKDLTRSIDQYKIPFQVPKPDPPKTPTAPRNNKTSAKPTSPKPSDPKTPAKPTSSSITTTATTTKPTSSTASTSTASQYTASAECDECHKKLDFKNQTRKRRPRKTLTIAEPSPKKTLGNPTSKSVSSTTSRSTSTGQPRATPSIASKSSTTAHAGTTAGHALESSSTTQSSSTASPAPKKATTLSTSPTTSPAPKKATTLSTSTTTKQPIAPTSTASKITSATETSKSQKPTPPSQPQPTDSCNTGKKIDQKDKVLNDIGRICFLINNNYFGKSIEENNKEGVTYSETAFNTNTVVSLYLPRGSTCKQTKMPEYDDCTDSFKHIIDTLCSKQGSGGTHYDNCYQYKLTVK